MGYYVKFYVGFLDEKTVQKIRNPRRKDEFTKTLPKAIRKRTET